MEKEGNNIMHPKDRKMSENERRVWSIQRNFNYVIGKFYKRKICMKLGVVKIIRVYAKKKGVTKSIQKACQDFVLDTANDKHFEYIDIFHELIRLRYIRHVGKKSHWLPNEGVVLTKKGDQWIKQNFNDGDYRL